MGCVEVSHHKNVGRTIEEWEKSGRNLYSYTAAGARASEKYHCRNCGIEISSERHLENDGLCDKCASEEEIDDEDSDLIPGGGW